MYKKVLHNVFICMCLGVFFLPGVLTVVQKSNNTDEARALAPFPSFSIRTVLGSGYFTEMDNYLSDHFGLRQYFVTTYGRALYSLGVSAHDNVLVGKNNWLFIREHAIEQVTGQNMYSNDEYFIFLLHQTSIVYILSNCLHTFR